MSAIVRVFNLFPRYSYEVGVLCDTVEQGQEFVNWNCGQISREMAGEYLGSTVEHQSEADDGYAADYDATKPLEENGLSYAELLKLAREMATQTLRSELWSHRYTDTGSNGAIRAAVVDCQKLGLDVAKIEKDFNDEYAAYESEDEE